MMAIGHIEMQGQIMRAQDYSQIKQQDDQRPEVSQTILQQQMAKTETRQMTRVNSRTDIENQMKKFDAKEKGSNEYHGDGGKNRNQKKEEDGKVILKGVTG
jgi:hypothetical protein